MRTIVLQSPTGPDQVLVTVYDSGEVEVARREENGGVWGLPYDVVSDREVWELGDVASPLDFLQDRFPRREEAHPAGTYTTPEGNLLVWNNRVTLIRKGE